MVCFSASTLAHEQQRYLDAGFDDFIGKPFRYEQLVEGLSRLLKVTLEEVPAATEPTRETSFAGLRLPPVLQKRLREAAERSSATRVAQAVAELQAMGEAERTLAARLGVQAQAGDFDGMLSVLDTIQPGSE